jgi:glycosyltransferase involved in cell wall biosynthesis
MEMPAILPAFGGREPESILFIGTFQHHPNADAAAWMVTDIFPRIAQHHPRAILHVVGADPLAFFREQASRWPGIRVHGFVPEVDRFLDTCRVFLAPLRFGGGVKIKVLHAMSHGIPVVTTKIGIEGIEGYEPGMAKVGGTADELARHVCSLLEDQPQAETMAAAARAMVERTFSWNALQERVEDIYHRASSPPHHPTVDLSGEEHWT